MPGIGALRWALRYEVDSTRREVRTTVAGTFESRAFYREGRGCTVVRGERPPDALLPEDRAAEALPPAIAASSPPVSLVARLDAAVDRAFAEPDQPGKRRTKAVVIVQNGRLVAERYAPGYGIDTPLFGWSLAKSVTNALVGVLVRQGRLSVDEPAPVPVWRDPADPRHAITIDHLLRMTSGLALDETHSGFDPLSRMLFLERDMGGFAERARLQAKPGSTWDYTGGNTLILSRIIRDAVGGHAGDVLRFARRELFGPLGMRSTTLEFDATGTPVGSTYVFASGRDWARFGMLYVDDGVVNGRRILPESWVRYSSSPTLHAGYGAGFWLGAPEWRASWEVPRDSFFASGMLGQRLLVVPSERLVIARFGVTHGEDEGLGRLISDVIAASRVPP
jgi:CubicO group peptidase (beta-lactamase class C family)